MTKKDRTGLQSRISHIFSGVPIPKKSHLAGDGSIAAPKPEESDVTQMPASAEDVIEWKTEHQADTGNSVIEKPVSESQSPRQTPAEEDSKQTTPAEQISIIQNTENIAQDTEYSAPQFIAGAEAGSSLDIPKESPFIEPPVKTPVRVPAFVIEKKAVPPGHQKSTPRPKVKAKAKAGRPKTDAGWRRQKVQLAVLIGFSILLVFILFNPFKVYSRAISPAGAGLKEPALTVGTDNAIIKVNWLVPLDYPPDIQDPMGASVMPVEPQSLIPIVTGITISEDKRQVVISGYPYPVDEGQQINGFTVSKIPTEKEVIFEKDGQKIVVRLNEKSGEFEIEK